VGGLLRERGWEAYFPPKKRKTLEILCSSVQNPCPPRDSTLGAMVGTYALREVGEAQTKIVESCIDSCLSLKSTFETELDPLVKQVGSSAPGAADVSWLVSRDNIIAVRGSLTPVRTNSWSSMLPSPSLASRRSRRPLASRSMDALSSPLSQACPPQRCCARATRLSRWMVSP